MLLKLPDAIFDIPEIQAISFQEDRVDVVQVGGVTWDLPPESGRAMHRLYADAMQDEEVLYTLRITHGMVDVMAWHKDCVEAGQTLPLLVWHVNRQRTLALAAQEAEKPQ